MRKTTFHDAGREEEEEEGKGREGGNAKKEKTVVLSSVIPDRVIFLPERLSRPFSHSFRPWPHT
jgi:hypothetical protein